MNRPTLLIRADAAAQFGTGHVMRCLALAQTWQDAGGDVALATAELPDALQSRLEREAITCHRLSAPRGSEQDAAAFCRLAQEQNPAWIAIDGYAFSATYQQTVRGLPSRLLWIDDYAHAAPYVADLVLNQNVGIDPALYCHRRPETRLLLGPRYALIRRELLLHPPARAKTFPTDRPARVLVTMGGADPDNVTAKVIEALRDLPLEVTALLGAANPHADAIRAMAGPTVRVVQGASDMSELLIWADLAISAAGSTCYELALYGVPMLLIVLADNQRDAASSLASNGAATNMGRADARSSDDIRAALLAAFSMTEQLDEQARIGRSLVDGLGGNRVVGMMNDFRPTSASSSALIEAHCLEIRNEF